MIKPTDTEMLEFCFKVRAVPDNINSVYPEGWWEWRMGTKGISEEVSSVFYETPREAIATAMEAEG